MGGDGLEELAAAVEAELERQIEVIRGLGVAVFHLGGHHHIHTVPKLALVVAAPGRTHGILAIRLPDATGSVACGLARLRWRLISHYAARAKGIFAEAVPAHAEAVECRPDSRRRWIWSRRA